RLFIAVHHLVIDGVSWRILFEDIDTLYHQYKNRQPAELPLKTGSFKLWSQQLSQYANSKLFLKEKPYWKKTETAAAAIPKIPGDFETDENKVKHTRSLSFRLNQTQTNNLFTKVNKSLGTEINDILLTALGLAIKKTWGLHQVLYALEGHGREQILGDIDMSRTVGWFTCIYPVILNISYENQLSRQIKEVKETLHQLPHKGIGYGILKYLTANQHKPDMEFKAQPQVSFNYLGQFDEEVQQKSFTIARESTGNPVNNEEKRNYELDITAISANRQLTVSISYNKKQFKSTTIQTLSDHYRNQLNYIISFCSKLKERELTPSDLTYKKLSLDELDRLKNEYPLEDIYPLSPMQEGMYFHHLYDRSSYAYFEQASYRMHGNLNIPCAVNSLNELLKRHDILRTVFILEGEKFLQVVLKERKIDFLYEDISTRDDRNDYLNQFKERDKKRSFDLSKDVLIRAAIFKSGPATYEFTWSIHHILIDGWCLGILVSEFFEIYQCFLEKRAHRLPPVKQYKTYIQWLEKQDEEITRNYWEKYLQGYEEAAGVSVLNFHKPKTGHPGYQQQEIVLQLPKEKTNGLNLLAGRNNVTMNVIIQALWSVLLGKYNRKTDLVFGAVVAGRPPAIEGVESMVGLFINTIPVRVQYKEDITFTKLLKKIQKEALESNPHHYYPLAKIQSQSMLKQNLLDHILIFENYPTARQIEGISKGSGSQEKEKPIPLKLSNVNIFEQTNYNFNLFTAPGNQLSIKLTYNANVYDSQALERTVKHLHMIIDQILTREQIALNELTLLSPGEKKKILVEINDTNAAYPRDKTLHRLFTEQMEQTPDHIALVEPPPMKYRSYTTYMTYISYRELDKKSNQLAHKLIEKGVGTDNFVAIMIERSAEMIIGILGILKTGGAYLPIDPDYPQNRIDYMLKDSSAKILLTRQEIAAIYSPPAFKLRPKDTSIHQHLSPAPVTSLAYILYTSGTTGKPKGVVIQHKSVVNTLFALYKKYPFEQSDVYLLKTSYMFDVSVSEIFGWVLGGGKLAILEKGAEKDPQRILNAVETMNITHINFVPSMFNALVSSLDRNNTGKLSGLKYIFLAGEVLLPEAVNKFNQLHPGCLLENIYGPTEASIYASWYSLSDWDGKSHIPIGKPLDNVRLYILNSEGHLQPIGIPGELCISGAGLARGYLNQPQLTAEKFDHDLQDYQDKKKKVTVKKNYMSLEGTRGLAPLPEKIYSYLSYRSHMSYIYRTGDLARWLPDSNIEFLGRIDHQVKIRGFRIELEEIENQLLIHENINDVVVIDREDKNGYKYLCAFIVSAKDIDVTELRQRLSKNLPDYMIPAYFMQLDKLPLHPGGKVNRKALPGLEIKPAKAYIPPGNEIEETLVDTWSKVLDIKKEKIGIKEKFFQLGGHSLNALSLISLLHKNFNVEVPLAEIFKNPTIKELAQYIRTAKESIYSSIQPVEKKEYYPMSPAQKRLYLLNQLDRQSVNYNMPLVMIVEGNPDRLKFENTFKKMLARHESLRTSFEMIDYELIQEVHEDMEFAIEYYDISEVEEEERSSLLEGTRGLAPLPIEPAAALINSFIRPFDLSQAPLLRVGLVKVKDQKHIFMMDMHHIITDGLSTGIFVKDFTAFYRGWELPELRVQYKDYSDWQNKQREKEKQSLEKQETYWMQQFQKDIPVLQLKTSFPRPPLYSFKGDKHFLRIDEKLTTKARQLALESNGTLNIFLLTVYYVLLLKYTGQEDIVVGMPISGRDHIELQDTIGFFANMLALRNRPEKNKTFENFLKEVTVNSLEAYENKDIQFEKLVHKLKIKREPGRHPLVETVFAFHHDEDITGTIQEIQKHDLKLIPYEFKEKISHFDLMINPAEVSGSINLVIEYNTTLFKRSMIEEFAKHYIDILDQVVENKELKLKDIKVAYRILAAKPDSLEEDPGDWVLE
ncbi:MAG: amino acid adenylation domain-containing protein, partial [Candidatus Aminicenantes bacterium]